MLPAGYRPVSKKNAIYFEARTELNVGLGLAPKEITERAIVVGRRESREISKYHEMLVAYLDVVHSECLTEPDQVLYCSLNVGKLCRVCIHFLG